MISLLYSTSKRNGQREEERIRAEIFEENDGDRERGRENDENVLRSMNHVPMFHTILENVGRKRERERENRTNTSGLIIFDWKRATKETPSLQLFVLLARSVLLYCMCHSLHLFSLFNVLPLRTKCTNFYVLSPRKLTFTTSLTHLPPPPKSFESLFSCIFFAVVVPCLTLPLLYWSSNGLKTILQQTRFFFLYQVL